MPQTSSDPDDHFSLPGRVAVVTGAGRGLGRCHALALAKAGAAVVVNDLGVALDGGGHGATPAESVVREIAAGGGRALASTADISRPEGGAALIEQAVEAFGRIDILVNNAGILRDRSAHKMTVEDAAAVLAVHLSGAFHTTLPAFARMRAQKFGRIIHTTSASGLFGNFGQANYGAAKTGLIGLTRVLAIEGAGHDVLSNAISPCATTRMTEQGFGQNAALFNPALVSPMVVYLASPGCAVNGEIFSIGGGQAARIFIGLTQGVFDPQRLSTAQGIAAAMPAIRDPSRFTIPSSLAAEWQKMLRQHGIEA